MCVSEIHPCATLYRSCVSGYCFAAPRLNRRPRWLECLAWPCPASLVRQRRRSGTCHYRTPYTRPEAPDGRFSTNALRDRVHAVIAAHDGKVDPQRDLDVGVPQPRAYQIERDPAGHQPVPGGTVPQAVSPSAPLPGTRRFLTQASPFDPIADVPESRAHAEWNELVPRRTGSPASS